MGLKTRVHVFDFKGPMTPPLTASPDGTRWRKADTSENGTPTLAATGGFMKGALTSTNEVQNLCLYLGDDLCFDIDDILRADFLIKVGSQGIGAAVTLSFGLCSARNDDPEAMAAHISFKCAGSSSVVVSTDDGVVDTNAIAAGDTLGQTLKRFSIDFRGGVKTVSPGPSLGGKAALQLSMSDGYNNRRRIAPRQLFDVSNYSAGLQPYVQLQKTAAATVAEFYLHSIEIEEIIRA